jgi:hypothetical protein
MHDELVRGWTNVSQWLDEIDAGVGMRTLASLGDAVRSWHHHGWSDAYLWNDPRLELLYDRAHARPSLLNAEEARFVERSARRRRRRRAQLIGGLLTATVVLAIVAAAALWQRQRATDQEKQATESARRATDEATRATQSEKTARERLAASYMEQGRGLLMDGHAMQALPYLVAARTEGIDNPVLRMLFAQASSAAPLATMAGHRMIVRMAAFSADGARVVTASWDNTARVWKATGEPVTAPLAHQARSPLPRSARTARGWSPGAGTIRRACGTRRWATRSRRRSRIRAWSMPRRSARTARGW